MTVRILSIAFLFAFSAATAFGQGSPKPPGVPIKEIQSPEKPSDTIVGVSGRIYSNPDLGFRITFPDEWLIPGDDFEDYLKSQGIDIGLKAPESIGRIDQIQLERALERVRVLVTAYRAMPGSEENAIVRVAAEDLSTVPQVKDAVDYVDLMRSQFAAARTPPDFKYSETQAERLGRHQFAFIDTENNAGKKRMYVTVRRGVALLFTLSYSKPADLATFRRIMSECDFSIKPQM
ncbi:MAG: hypothetical protein IPM21_13980 [Acidobacteria bacterium]|nr:hypothetical protein [Acidobacteriota bacterium]